MNNSNIFLLLALLILASFPLKSFGGADCLADVSKYTEEGLKSRVSIFRSDAGNIKKYLPSKLIPYGFEDAVVLRNGTLVTFSVGGCAHYGYKFHFKGEKLKKLSSVKTKTNRALALLKNIETTSSVEKNTLLEALSKIIKLSSSEKSTKPIKLPCGDATCLLVDKDDHEVEISYSFML